MVSAVHLSILRKGDVTLNYTTDLIGFIIDQFIFAFISIIRRSSTGSTDPKTRVCTLIDCQLWENPPVAPTTRITHWYQQTDGDGDFF